jgi:hypothetical protein
MTFGVRDHFRAHGRRKVSLAAKVRRLPEPGALGGPAPPSEAGRVVDLSLGGACVRLHVAAAPYRDAMVTVEIMAPTLWDPLALRARVVWVRSTSEGTSLGLRFEHAEGGALTSLVQLLGAHAFAGT